MPQAHMGQHTCFSALPYLLDPEQDGPPKTREEAHRVQNCGYFSAKVVTQDIQSVLKSDWAFEVAFNILRRCVVGTTYVSVYDHVVCPK